MRTMMSGIGSSEDGLWRLLFEDAHARAHLIRLDQSFQGIVSRHASLAAPVIQLLGEMAASAALLSGSLKFEGSVLLQLHGDGPVRLAIAECTADLQLRGTATCDESQVILPTADLRAMANRNALGRLSLILDPQKPGQKPYQGIVALEAERLAQAVEDYMSQSEQVKTRLWLACDGQRAAGLMIQQMPLEGGHSSQPALPASLERAQREEGFHRLCLLGDTLQSEELLTTPAEQLLHQLFWDENARLLEQQPVQFGCPCNRMRVGRMLTSLGRAEIESILSEQGQVEIHCHFCNAGYRFDPIDCARLFTETDLGLEASTGPGPSQTRH
ncbi:COG1281 Disulfide bond chaperones of the HSP33 family [Burkholderiales bacterium]